ncbi:hypothetical protein GCM10007416_17720 [Kroppenstedtia guangzhouensis]|uniref:Uncharacterized protein n=1 Tax=Kroppenstedtia guangzhouensis TaxID=1274356 RepID=A0ABQ1GK25_9BACL|nr:hypothetical protein GCM10007416_17720 [Kroppenstedtia guangzhouensis]
MDACPFVWTKNLILSERNTDTPAGQNRRGLVIIYSPESRGLDCRRQRRRGGYPG